jgi:hypothetical protein
MVLVSVIAPTSQIGDDEFYPRVTHASPLRSSCTEGVV